MKRLLLLSGPIAVGKSAVAKMLVERHNFRKLGTGQYLKELAERQGRGSSRAELQALGDELVVSTNYRWLIDEIVEVQTAAAPEQEAWLLDSVRKRHQVINFKEIYGRLAFHVYLKAPEEILQQRYEARIARGGEYTGNTPYNEARNHANEVESRSLIGIADFVVDLSNKPPEEVAAEILYKWDRGKHAPGRSD